MLIVTYAFRPYFCMLSYNLNMHIMQSTNVYTHTRTDSISYVEICVVEMKVKKRWGEKNRSLHELLVSYCDPTS